VEIDVQNFIRYFTSIFYEALPFIVLGAVAAGVLEEFVPQRWVLKCIPRNRVLAIAMGALLGLPFPMCECGILIIMRRLLRKGVPLSCCVAYMLAGPIINFVVMLSTWFAFSGKGDSNSLQDLGGVAMMSLRMAMGFMVAVGTGLIVERQYRRHGAKLLAAGLLDKAPSAVDDPAANGSSRPLTKRISAAAEVALHDFVDISVYLILGALIAAFVRMRISPHEFTQLSQNMPAAAILIMMGLAVVLCLCSEADAFVAASFVGLNASAKLGFLVLGPMLDFKLYMMYLRVYKPRLIWTIIGSVVTQVFVYSLAFNYLWQAYGWMIHPATAGR
jgi:uncharacterized membrane protein YraQ (UPF0718 family)